MNETIDKVLLNAAANVEVETGDISKQTLNEIKEYLISELDSNKNQNDDVKKQKGDENGKSK